MKKYASAIMLILGISAFAKNESGVFALTDDQKTTLTEAGWNEGFVAKFNTALGLNFAEGTAQTDETIGLSTADTQSLIDTSLALANAEMALEAAKNNVNALATEKATLQSTVTTLKGQVQTLSNKPELDEGAGAQHAQSMKTNVTFDPLDEKQLGGLQGEMFALEGRPYNQRARAVLLAKQGMMVTVPMATDSSVDFAALEADLGAYYRQNRSQALNSFVASLPNQENIFPLESGIQDREIITNMFMGEFSQADSSDESEFDQVVKGKYEIQPEEIRMYGIMFAHNFKGMKKLEKQWIGYLNREGSSSIKISFIEYILQETAKVLQNEREQRRMNGVRKNPIANVPGKALEGATGLYRYMADKVNDLVVKPFVLGDVTPTNIGEKVKLGTKQIPQVLKDSGRIALYMPQAMVDEYHAYLETHYGLQPNFVAGSMFVKEYPQVKIIPVLNCGNHRRLIWTLEGNIKTFEDKPGEMTNFRIMIKEFGVSVVSQWKEGMGAILTGKKWTRAQDMDYNHQFLFCSDKDLAADEFLAFEQDVTTPSALFHSSLVSVANTALKTITNITDVEVGAQVILKNGSDNYGIALAKSGNFSEIASAWNPAIGDTITLMKRQDGKFLEISRAASGAAALVFAADATAPSLEGGVEFQVGLNTAATAIATLADGVTGTVYTIHGNGSGANVSTIAANNTAILVTGLMTFNTGTYLQLVLRADGKYQEVARG